MVQTVRRLSANWIWLLALFTLASFIETIFWGQMSSFTPLYLPHLGVPAGQVAAWTGIIAAVASALGLPFLPFWGALADRLHILNTPENGLCAFASFRDKSLPVFLILKL